MFNKLVLLTLTSVNAKLCQLKMAIEDSDLIHLLVDNLLTKKGLHKT